MTKRSLRVMSFGFKHGEPDEVDQADLIVDCRVLRNPHRMKGLRYLTGMDERVQEDVQGSPGFEALIEETCEKVRKAIVDELPTSLESLMRGYCVAFGCHGGRHRSVVCALEVAHRLSVEFEQVVRVEHRDIGETP